MKKKIIIIGGGIAGLSVAHILCNYDNFDITILESEKDIGGQARSMFGKHCFIEYSWRIFGYIYHNLNKIINDIDADNNFDTLNKPCIIDNNNVPRYGGLSVFNLGKNILKTADINQINRLSDIFTISRDRAINEYDDILAYEYFKKHPIMQTIMGPFLGLDANKISLSAYYKNILSTQDKYEFYFTPKNTRISKYPTQESLFIPWINYLKSKGVKIITNTPVLNFKVNSNSHNIEYLTIHNKSQNNYNNYNNNNNNNISKIIGDEYIFACSLKQLNRMIDLEPYFIEYPLKNNLKKLESGLQLYYTINMYFSDKFPLTINNDSNLSCNEMILVNSSWKLIIQRKHLWGDKYLSKCKMNSKNMIKDVINVGFLDNNPGEFNKKILRDCSKEEAIIEGIMQFKNNKYIKKILKERNINFEDIFAGYEDWYEFKNNENNKLISTNPKFSNNLGLQKYMPKKAKVDELNNMFLSGYYITSTMGGASMEASCETGLNAGLAVLNKYNINVSSEYQPINHNVQYIHNLTIGLVYLDKLLYKIGIGSINNIIPSLLLIIIYTIVILLLFLIIIKKLLKFY